MTWPILVLPTPTGLQNALGGPISSLVFGAPSSTLLALIVGGLVAGLVLLLVGLLVGAWAERHLIAIALDAAADEGILAPAPDLAGRPARSRSRSSGCSRWRRSSSRAARVAAAVRRRPTAS